MLVLRKESGNDGPAAVVNAENQRTVDHLQNEEITAAVHGHEDARCTTRLDFHADVDVQTDTERFLCLDVTAVGSKEGTVFHFGGTRLRSFRVNWVTDWSTVGSVIQIHVNSCSTIIMTCAEYLKSRIQPTRPVSTPLKLWRPLLSASGEMPPKKCGGSMLIV